MNEIPRLRFAHLPTPVEAMPRLEKAFNGPHLLIKRDDQTGLAFGGNKTRKLEFLLADAQSCGADMLLTSGAVQSNHCRQTAAAAAKYGFDCTLVLAGEQPQSASANLMLDRMFWAHILWTDKAHRDQTLHDAVVSAKARGRKPYLVPYGGSSPAGILGYVFAMQEFIAQGQKADWIVFASSSGGTQAGLVLGARLFNCSSKILGISVDERKAVLQERVAGLASETSARLGPHISFEKEQVLVNDDYSAQGYGVLTPAEQEAIRAFAKYEGLLLDPVYTGRAAAGLLDLIRKGFFHKDDTVLFWHTGGGPAMFADQYRDRLV